MKELWSCRLINEQWRLKINIFKKFLSILEVVTSFFGLFSFNNNKLLLLFMYFTFQYSFAHSFCITFLKINKNSHIKDRMWKFWMDMCKMWIKQVIVELNYWNTCMYFILKQFVGFEFIFLWSIVHDFGDGL